MVEADLSSSNLSGLLTVNLAKMPHGSCRYGFLLNEQAGIIDDLVIYRISASSWMIVVNAATTEGDFAYLRENLSGAKRLENVSAGLGKLDLQGPASGDVLAAFAGEGIRKLGYYAFGHFDVLGENIIVSRTGYTGEIGYELYMPNANIPRLWDELLGDSRVRPIGLGARDTLRLEMGYSLYGHDIDENTTPLEAGLGCFIDWGKEFAGKKSLLAQKERGLARRMVYFAADSRRSPRHGYRIIFKDNDVGRVTSGSFSPSLGIGIGMGYVTEDIREGENIVLKENSVSINAKLTGKPFYKNGSAKSGEIK